MINNVMINRPNYTQVLEYYFMHVLSIHMYILKKQCGATVQCWYVVRSWLNICNIHILLVGKSSGLNKRHDSSYSEIRFVKCKCVKASFT